MEVSGYPWRPIVDEVAGFAANIRE